MGHKFHVGDAVRFWLVNRNVIGRIIEDRGPLGSRGQHIYGIVVNLGTVEPTYFELGEDMIELSSKKMAA